MSTALRYFLCTTWSTRVYNLCHPPLEVGLIVCQSQLPPFWRTSIIPCPSSTTLSSPISACAAAANPESSCDLSFVESISSLLEKYIPHYHVPLPPPHHPLPLSVHVHRPPTLNLAVNYHLLKSISSFLEKDIPHYHVPLPPFHPLFPSTSTCILRQPRIYLRIPFSPLVACSSSVNPSTTYDFSTNPASTGECCRHRSSTFDSCVDPISAKPSYVNSAVLVTTSLKVGCEVWKNGPLPACKKSSSYSSV